jgi:predicted MFS family arabinose efflux permease
MLPGIAALVVTSLALQAASAPVLIVALMAGLGVANGLIATPARVLVARESYPTHRGEALGTYYLCSSLGIAVGPSLAFGLRAVGGMRLAFAAVTALAICLLALASRFASRAGEPAAAGAPRLALVSRSAAPVSGALVLSTIGHSAV